VDREFDYDRTVSLGGPAARAIDAATAAFNANGFRIRERGESSIEAEGPGINNSRENPILGASLVQLRVFGDSLSLRAELRAIGRLFRFLGLLIAALAVANTTWLLVVYRHRPGFALLLGLLPFVPWVVLLPLMAAWFRRRTVRALDALLHNISLGP
jgi:hypothetical protein